MIYRGILLESRTIEGDSPVREIFHTVMIMSLEYHGTREILWEPAATMR